MYMKRECWQDMDTCPTEEGRTILVWHLFQGTMVTPAQTARKNRYHAYWTEMPTTWISPAKRLPTPADADAQNCVICLDKHDVIAVLGWHQVQVGGRIIGWNPCPEPPELTPEMKRQRA